MSGEQKHCISDSDGAVFEVNYDSIGQQTGKQDENKKDIYCGDEVFLSGFDRRGKVYYCETSLCYRIECKDFDTALSQHKVSIVEEEKLQMKMNYDIAIDAIEDAIGNREIAEQPRDGGLDEALKIIKDKSTRYRYSANEIMLEMVER